MNDELLKEAEAQWSDAFKEAYGFRPRQQQVDLWEGLSDEGKVTEYARIVSHMK
jgi:hypothetical protein